MKEELRSLQGDLVNMMEKMSDRIDDIIEALDDAPIEVGEPEVVETYPQLGTLNVDSGFKAEGVTLYLLKQFLKFL